MNAPKITNATDYFDIALRQYLGFLIDLHQFELQASKTPPVHFEEFIWLYRKDVVLIFCVTSWQVTGISIGKYGNGMAQPIMPLEKLIAKRVPGSSVTSHEQIVRILRQQFPEILNGELPEECRNLKQIRRGR